MPRTMMELGTPSERRTMAISSALCRAWGADVGVNFASGTVMRMAPACTSAFLPSMATISPLTLLSLSFTDEPTASRGAGGARRTSMAFWRTDDVSRVLSICVFCRAISRCPAERAAPSSDLSSVRAFASASSRTFCDSRSAFRIISSRFRSVSERLC